MNCMIKILIIFKLCYLRYFIDLSNIVSFFGRCKIYFYLEDDSIQVIEPKVENSGIPQGMLIFFFDWNVRNEL